MILSLQLIHLYDARNYSSGAFAEMKLDRASVVNSISSKLSRPDMNVSTELANARWTTMRFNKSGKQILVTTDKGIVLMIDGYDGKLTHSFLSSSASNGATETQPSSACFSSDDKTVLCGNEDGSISCYDSTTGELVRVMKGHVGNVGCIATNPKYQQFASSCTNTALWLW